MTNDTKYWLFAAIGLALVAILLLAPIGFGPTEFGQTIENASHGVLFGLVAVGALLFLRARLPSMPRSRRYAIAFLSAVALGGLGELAQWFTGWRDAEWGDFVNDALGAFAALCLFAIRNSRATRRRSTRTLLASLACVAAAIVVAPIVRSGFDYWQRRAQLPELATWRSAAGHHFFSASNSETTVILVPSPWARAADEPALSIDPLQGGRWPGVVTEEPWPDWDGYSQLAVDVVNPNDVPLRLNIRINDREHNNRYNDRFNRTATVPPRQRMRWKISLSDVRRAPAGREMDMRSISRVAVFQDAEAGAHRFYLCRLYLER